MKILGTGLTGMVGSRIVDVLKNDHTFENMSLSNGIDIRDAPQVFDRIADSDADVILHLAAKSDVEECEKDREDIKKFRIDGLSDLDSFNPDTLDPSKWRDSLSAYAVNVIGTNNIALACKAHNKRLVHISTDYVFEGDTREPYKESDIPLPVNFYGRTKRIAEIVAQHIVPDAVILRISYPYGSTHQKNKGFVTRIGEKLKEGKEVLSPTDSLITPTYIDDIASALEVVLGAGVSGIYHIAGSSSLSPYEASLAIAETFGYDKNLVKQTTHAQFYQGKAPRPQYLVLSTQKAEDIGVHMKGFDKGLQEVGKRG